MQIYNFFNFFALSFKLYILCEIPIFLYLDNANAEKIFFSSNMNVEGKHYQNNNLKRTIFSQKMQCHQEKLKRLDNAKHFVVSMHKDSSDTVPHG